MKVENSQINSFVSKEYFSKQEERLHVNKQSLQVAVSLPQTQESSSEILSQSYDAKTRLTIYILEAMTGQKVNLKNFQTKESNARNLNLQSNAISLTYERVSYEQSSANFGFKGEVVSEDGREFSFELTVKFNQEFVEFNRLDIQNGQILQDPLILSLDNQIPLLNEQIDFNLNENSNKINLLSQNAGYIALDKNKNGIIDGGNELFGPQSGDGFLELQSFDEDGNNWIDENDTIFKQLSFWQPSSSDEGLLTSLQQIGIGALSLEKIGLDYTLKSSINEEVGIIKEASVALSEKGESFSIFSVDLSV